MELWLMIIAITSIITFLLKSHFSSKLKSDSKKWPPGPKTLPLITLIIWFRRSFSESQTALKALSSKFGPIITLSTSTARPVIFIFSRALAYQALIQKGALFADRPKPLVIAKILSSNQHTITFATYGPLWRILRRNLTFQTLHPSRVKDFSLARKWALDVLLNNLKVSSVGTSSDATGGKNNASVKVVDHFRFAMFHLLLMMCFGDKLEESKVKEIEATLQELLTSLFSRFRVLNLRQVWLTKILFRSRWNEFHILKKKQEDVLIPLIRARKQHQEAAKKSDQRNDSTTLTSCYLDTLLTLEIPCSNDSKTEGTRRLTEENLVNLCFEFLNAGTDTTSTTLQWIMANLVRNTSIQDKVFEEIKGVIGENSKEVLEGELSKMPYLKAVVLEGLRRHPPGHFLLPHGVTREVELGGYIIPKNASLNFAIAEICQDSEVWDDPLEFKPERFMGMIMESDIDHEDIDITEFGSREIKMMPFGAGRRICPGRKLALLHLEYFVANLIWNFEWIAMDGDEVDLSEKQEFTIVMKYPLRVHIFPRKK